MSSRRRDDDQDTDFDNEDDGEDVFAGDEEDDEDFDEEELDEEEDEKRGGKSRSKSQRRSKRRRTAYVDEGRRQLASGFIDMEAQEDDEEDDEDYDDARGDIGAFITDDAEAGAAGHGLARHAAALLGDAQLRTGRDVGVNRVTRTISDLEKRYANVQEGDDEIVTDDMLDQDDDDEIASHAGGRRRGLDQQRLYPTINDPKLFMVPCKYGKEREAALTLMQKFFNYEQSRQKEDLKITSVVVLDSLKGFIYVEAFRESHAKAAIKGVQYLNEYKVKLVPIKEMTEVLSNARNKSAEVKENQWVRIKRGLYKGDLAKVWNVDDARATAVVQLIPRLERGDDGSVVFKERAVGEKRGRAPSSGVRPAQKLLNDSDTVNVRVETKKDLKSGETFQVIEGKKFKDGYIFKSVSFKGLETKNVDPQLDELSKFHQGAAGEGEGTSSNAHDLAQQALAIERRVKFQKGDSVVVVNGDLRNMQGTVIDISRQDALGGEVTIMPKHNKINTPLKFKPEDLRKHFDLGTFVQVTHGKNEGESGHIVKVDDTDGTVTLYSDIKKVEIKAFINDVQKASEAMATSAAQAKHGALAQYSLHDLVRFDGQLVGVIVKVEGDTFKILDMAGTVKTRSIQQINGKQSVRLDSKVSDRARHQVGADDNVKIVDGPYKGKSAVIKHVYKGILFCHARDVVENAGVFVVKARQVELRAVVSAAPSAKSGSGSFAQPAPRRRVNRNDPLLGKTVKIRAGQYKGYMGVVREVTGMLVKVELHSIFRTINVSKTDLVEAGNEDVRITSDDSYSRMPPATPAYAPMTPFNDGSETPFNDGSRTPGGAFDPNVPNTPYHSTMEHQYGGMGMGSGLPTTPGLPDSSFGSGAVQTPAMPYATQPTPAPAGPVHTPFAQTPYGVPIHTPHIGGAVQTPGLPQTSVVQAPGLPLQQQTQTPMPYGMTPMPAQPYGSSVQTPGVNTPFYQGSGAVQTPFQAYPPQTSAYTPHLPQATPMPMGGSIATPHAVATPHQPFHTPQTGGPINTPAPGSSMGFYPTTPGVSASLGPAGSGMDHPGADEWAHENVEVEIIDGTYRGDKAIITKIDRMERRCIVKILPDGPDSFEIDTDKLRPTQPKSRDSVLIISGEHKGRVGRLANIDFDAAVVRFGREEMQFLRIGELVKLCNQ